MILGEQTLIGNTRKLDNKPLFYQDNDSTKLNQNSKISYRHIKKIIIYYLKPEYIEFIATIQSSPTQLSLLQLENLLANQEILAKQMVKVSRKSEEKTLFTSKKIGNRKAIC